MGVIERSTDEARNSITILRLTPDAGESVLITMSGSTLREHAGTSVRAPSSSTTQIRQAFAGVRVSPKQSVGVSIPSWLASVEDRRASGTSTAVPSIVS